MLSEGELEGGCSSSGWEWIGPLWSGESVELAGRLVYLNDKAGVVAVGAGGRIGVGCWLYPAPVEPMVQGGLGGLEGGKCWWVNRVDISLEKGG